MSFLPDETLIERYVLRTLDEAEREAAERLLARDPAAQEIAQLLAVFYQALPGEEESGHAAAFAERLFALERIIPITPLRRRLARRVVLAAMTDTEPARIETLATLASSKDNVLVRILWAPADRRGWIYTLAENPARRAHALISFPELHLTFVADADGRAPFTLPSSQHAIDWKEARAYLRLPLGTLSASGDDLAGGGCTRRLPAGDEVTCTYERDGVAFTVRPPAAIEDVPSLAVVEAGGEKTLVVMEDGTGHAALPAPPEELVIRFYP